MIRFITKNAYYTILGIGPGETRYKSFERQKIDIGGGDSGDVRFTHKLCYYQVTSSSGKDYIFIYLRELEKILIPESEWPVMGEILECIERAGRIVDWSDWSVTKISPGLPKLPWTINEHKRIGQSWNRLVYERGVYEIKNSRTGDITVFSIYTTPDQYLKSSYFGYREKAELLIADGELETSEIVEKEGLIEQIMKIHGGNYKRTDIKGQ